MQSRQVLTCYHHQDQQVLNCLYRMAGQLLAATLLLEFLGLHNLVHQDCLLGTWLVT